MKQKNRDNFGFNTEDKLAEWEKNSVKESYKVHDSDFKQGVTKDQLKLILQALMKDDCIIGKVPNLSEEESQILFEAWEPVNQTTNKFSWQ